MSRGLPRWATSVLGTLAVLAGWWLLSAIVPSTGSYAPVPSPAAVVATLLDDGAGLYWTNFVVTITEAGIGYAVGNAVALLMAALVLLLPRADWFVNQLAVITYCIPIVAIGPIAVVVLGGARSPGDPSATAVLFAGLSVVFTTVVGALLGLRAADRAALDVVSVYGGSRLTQLRKVRLVAAIPAVFTALQIAVPAAFLGAVLGEYFGKISRGVGPLLVSSQVALDSPRVWAVLLISALVAIVGFGLMGLLGRLAAPWSAGQGARA
ncbi:ABC transporter permease [Pseudokineococcus sp. 1T1Z-3]|uniref:ABC transporter permease n=1 Tax=Pseudokineococcus sp. 1T1Z-3 TaxID=3132745 RepID=UPI003095E2A0